MSEGGISPDGDQMDYLFNETELNHNTNFRIGNGSRVYQIDKANKGFERNFVFYKTINEALNSIDVNFFDFDPHHIDQNMRVFIINHLNEKIKDKGDIRLTDNLWLMEWEDLLQRKYSEKDGIYGFFEVK